MNIGINAINTKLIGERITFKGKIIEADEKKPYLNSAVFECNGCNNIYEVKRTTNVTKPVICDTCGGKSFKLLSDKSKYVDSQVLTVKDTDAFIDKYKRKRKAKRVKCIAFDEDVDQHIKEDIVTITGTLMISEDNEAIVKIEEIILNREG